MEKPLISHIGIAVSDLDIAIKQYQLLTGKEPDEICEVSDQKVKLAIFSGEAIGGRIELLTPTSDDSPISRYLKKRGEGLHHICIYVKDIEKKLAELKEAGVKLIDESPRIGAEGNRIAFVHPAGFNSVLIELEERAD